MIPKVGDIVRFDPAAAPNLDLLDSTQGTGDIYSSLHRVVMIKGPDKVGDLGVCLEDMADNVFWIRPPSGRWFTGSEEAPSMFILVTEASCLFNAGGYYQGANGSGSPGTSDFVVECVFRVPLTTPLCNIVTTRPSTGGVGWGFNADAEAGDLVPKNNDGRDTCFWCRIPTAKRGGGAYDVCPKCGR